MGKSILVLNGSPRMKGNTAILVEKLAESILEKDPDARIEVIRLNTLKIRPCMGCDACRTAKKSTPYCSVPDDMAVLYEKVARADCIVFASPI